MGKTVQTSYGAVDAKALSRMQNRFDTRRLFDAIDAIDRIRYRICAADGLRQDLLDLHSMAHEVINEDCGSSSSRKEPIWELAEMLSGEVLEFSDDLRSVFDTVEELEKLRPSEGDEDGEGDNEEEKDEDAEDWEKEDEDN
jgi:hypothetical protein